MKPDLSYLRNTLLKLSPEDFDTFKHQSKWNGLSPIKTKVKRIKGTVYGEIHCSWDKKNILQLTANELRDVIDITEGNTEINQANLKKDAKLIEKLTKKEKEYLDKFDSYLDVKNPNHTKNFDILWDKYAEMIASINYPRSRQDAECFEDETLKHQVWDWYRKPTRNGGKFTGKGDIAMILIKVLDKSELKEEAFEGLI